MFKDDIKTLKEQISIKRRQLNAYHEIKASLSENDLMLHVDFAEMTSKMPYKVHISEINVSGYLQRVAMLKFLIITMLEMTMLSLSPKVPTTTKSRLWVACKKLSTWSNKHMKKHTRTFMLGVMEWGHNLDLAYV